MEKLVHRLTYSRSPLLARLFGTSVLVNQCDPVIHAGIMADAEHQVYGLEGLENYEGRETSELKRLAKRSLAQFLCQRSLVGSAMIRFVRRLIFGVALIPVGLYFALRSFVDSWSVPPEGKLAEIVIFFLAERQRGCIDAQSFGSIPYLHRSTQVHLGISELSFIFRTVVACPRYLLHPELMVNVLRWLCYYGYVVRHFNPKVVANFFETTASSSLITAFLRERELQHIDIQHGELWFTANLAFSEFDEIRVWGAHFKDIFFRVHSTARRILENGNPHHRHLFNTIRPALQPRPKRLLILDPFEYSGEASGYPFMVRILQHVDSSWEIRIRRHPADRQPELAYLKRLNAEPSLAEHGIHVTEETPQEVAIDQALARSRVVVGVASAALIEAWIAGCKVIHLMSIGHRNTLMDRYQGSANVLYADANVELEPFLKTPAVLDTQEATRVDRVTAVLLRHSVERRSGLEVDRPNRAGIELRELAPDPSMRFLCSKTHEPDT